VALRAAYAALSLGLMGAGVLLVWLGLRRPFRPAGAGVRALLTLAALAGLAGAVIAAILEARPARPW
jgi:hypothetical protein